MEIRDNIKYLEEKYSKIRLLILPTKSSDIYSLTMLMSDGAIVSIGAAKRLLEDSSSLSTVEKAIERTIAEHSKKNKRDKRKRR